MGGLDSSSMETDLDRPNIEEYLTTETIREVPKKLHLYSFHLYYTFFFFKEYLIRYTYYNILSLLRSDLLDISPTLTEAAGAIVDVSLSLPFSQSRGSLELSLGLGRDGKRIVFCPNRAGVDPRDSLPKASPCACHLCSC